MKNDSVLFPAKGGFSFELYDIKKNDNALLFCCAWIQWFGCSESEVSLVVGLTVACSRPGPRVLAPAIILPLFGSGYLCWAVCFHVFHSSAVSWPDTQLSIWALRPCTLDAYAYIRCASFCKCIHVCKRARVCVFVRMQLCLFAPLYMHSDSQPYQCQRSAPGTPCCLLLWQTHLWSACSPQGQGWHNAWCQHKNCRS